MNLFLLRNYIVRASSSICQWLCIPYNDVTMTAMASQITSVRIVYSPNKTWLKYKYHWIDPWIFFLLRNYIVRASSFICQWLCIPHNDVTMTAMASQITSVRIVYSPNKTWLKYKYHWIDPWIFFLSRNYIVRAFSSICQWLCIPYNDVTMTAMAS